MNEQLKTLNKKILLINEVIAIEPLFETNSYSMTKRFAEKSLEKLLKKKTKMLYPFAEQEAMNIAKFCRNIFSNKTVAIKRKIKNDKLISIYIEELSTKNTFPLNPYKFSKLLDTIKV